MIGKKSYSNYAGLTLQSVRTLSIFQWEHYSEPYNIEYMDLKNSFIVKTCQKYL